MEAGVRGRISLAHDSGLNYDLSLFHTNSDDDIIFVNSATLNRAFFANVGQTRRQGISARADYKISRATAYLAYTYTEATFQTGYVEAGSSNPAKNADGNIIIKPDDELASCWATSRQRPCACAAMPASAIVGLVFDAFSPGGAGQLIARLVPAGEAEQLRP